MQPQMDNSTLDRRAFVLGAGAIAALAPLLAGRVAAQEAAPAWQEALKKIVGDAQPTTTGKLTFDLPEIAENGNMVPFAVKEVIGVAELSDGKILMTRRSVRVTISGCGSG
jgi:predicted secreted protein